MLYPKLVAEVLKPSDVKQIDKNESLVAGTDNYHLSFALHVQMFQKIHYTVRGIMDKP